MLSSFGISRGPFSYLIMLLIGIGAFVVIGLLSAQEQAFLQKSVLVDGKVTSFVKDDLNPKSISYAPVVQFITKQGYSVTFTAYGKEANPPGYNVGAVVKLGYDPKNPYNAVILGSQNNTYMLLGGIGLLNIGIAAAGLLLKWGK